MLGAAIIVFREAIEAGLIIGIAMAATRGVMGRGAYILGGVGGGLMGACCVALFAARLSAALDGNGQEYFNAAILLAAVVMLVWHNAWMASHGREMAAELRGVGAAVLRGDRKMLAMSLVCGAAVLREGSEVVLFLTGIAASGSLSTGELLGGVAAGLVGGAALAALIFVGLVAVPMRHFFSATASLITLLAAGLAAQAVNFLHQAGVISGFDTPLWDTSGVLAVNTLVGRMMQTLIGYTDQPDAAQLGAYVATLVVMWGAIKWARGGAERGTQAGTPAKSDRVPRPLRT